MPTNALGPIAILADPELMAVVRSDAAWPNYYKPEILRKIKEAVSLNIFATPGGSKLAKTFFKFIKSYIEARPETITRDAFSNLDSIVDYSIEHMKDKFFIKEYIANPNDNLLEYLDLIKTMFSTEHFHQYLKSAFQGILLLKIGVALEAILQNSPHNPLITPSLSQYFSILASSANNNALFIKINALLVKESLKLAKLCAISSGCNTAEINDKIAQVLGTFSYHLRNQNATSNAAATLEEHALPFLKDSSTHEKNLFDSFISGFFPNTPPENLQVECLRANVSAPICEGVTFIDSTTLNPTTTELPTPLVTSAGSTAQPTNNTTTSIPTDATNNPTAIDLFSPNKILPKLAGSFASGFVIVIKDETLHKLCTALTHILERRNCPAFVINMLKGTFWLINTASTATLPLLYAYVANIIQALNENETKDVLIDSQLIISISICCFLEACLTLPSLLGLLEKKSTFNKTINYLKSLLVFTGMITTSAHITEGLAVYGASAAGGLFGYGFIQLCKAKCSVNKKSATIPYSSQEIERFLSSGSSSSGSSGVSGNPALNVSGTYLEMPSTSQTTCSEPIYALPTRITSKEKEFVPNSNNTSYVKSSTFFEPSSSPVYEVPHHPPVATNMQVSSFDLQQGVVAKKSSPTNGSMIFKPHTRRNTYGGPSSSSKESTAFITQPHR